MLKIHHKGNVYYMFAEQFNKGLDYQMRQQESIVQKMQDLGLKR